MGAGLARCLPHSKVLMGAGLAGRPRLPHSQVLLGAGLAGRPSYLPQSGPYGCWASWKTFLSTTVRSLWVLG